jgi:hypothetical protein
MSDVNKKNTYGVFTNNNLNKKLVFYPCPKNANSSAKLFFIKHLKLEDSFYFLSDDVPEYKLNKKNKRPGKHNLIGFLPAKQKFSIMPDNFIKCCIIRDPVNRFLSAYKNRILFHRDLQFYNLNIDEVLSKLENGNYDNKHFLPQNYFLGMNLKYYDFYSDIKNIEKFKKHVNIFFERNLEFPKIQTGGKDFIINLSKSQIDKIKFIYKDDYVMIDSGN